MIVVVVVVMGLVVAVVAVATDSTTWTVMTVMGCKTWRAASPQWRCDDGNVHRRHVYIMM